MIIHQNSNTTLTCVWTWVQVEFSHVVMDQTLYHCYLVYTLRRLVMKTTVTWSWSYPEDSRFPLMRFVSSTSTHSSGMNCIILLYLYIQIQHKTSYWTIYMEHFDGSLLNDRVVELSAGWRRSRWCQRDQMFFGSSGSLHECYTISKSHIL